MASPAKRVLTSETRESSIASSIIHQSTPIDLAEHLRSLGSRVRKNVMEGYVTSPPSFIKANSTGSIFCSANDTLRDIYSPAPTNAPAVSPRKRTHQQLDQGYVSDGDSSEQDRDADMDIVNEDLDENVPIILGPDATSLRRPMKALRKPRRTMLTTSSLPTGSLRMGGEINRDPLMKGTEEDWSMNDNLEQSSLFKPMALS